MPPVANVVRRNVFMDSMQLMRLTEEAKKLAGVADAVIAMGTSTNKLLMEQTGLLTAEGRGATENDLVLAVRVARGASTEEALSSIESLLASPPEGGEGTTGGAYFGIRTALDNLPGANLAVISLPGSQAAGAAEELLDAGLNLHVFSDHVPIEDELRLKRLAAKRGLLVMGPGAGTSLINGVGIGFANAVRRGRVGVVAAAGTGLQEVSVLLDRVGLGVSQGLGVGGTDISREVGGIMMTECLGLLEDDRGTEILMIVAKTPNAEVMRKVMGFVEKRTTKPVVACFLGMEASSRGRLHYSKTLHSSVLRAARLSSPASARAFGKNVGLSLREMAASSAKHASKLKAGQRYVRGLYTGGTLAHESLLVFREVMGEAYSNTPLSAEFRLADPSMSKEHSVVDLGDEFFTAGRPHPMIDPTIRKLRLLQEAKDPTVAVVILDFVLGYGCAEDPAGSMAGSIAEARAAARRSGRELVLMAHVCGTPADPQSSEKQSQRLAAAGVALYPSNATMAVAAALVASRGAVRGRVEEKWGGLLG